MDQALKGHAASYAIEIQDSLDPLNHFTKTKEVVESHLKDLLKTMEEFKFIITLEATFEKNTFDSKTGKRESIHKTAYFSSKAKTFTNGNEIESELYASQQEVMGIIEVWISEGSRWTIDRVDNNYINFVNYKPLNGSSYIELPTELRNSSKGLINMENKDDECFRLCHISHFNPQKKYPQRIKKADKQYIEKLDNSNVMSQSIPTRYSPPPRQPPGISSKTLPGGSGFDFWKLPEGREFDKAGILWKFKVKHFVRVLVLSVINTGCPKNC